MASSTSPPDAWLRRLRIQLGRPGFQFSYQLADFVRVGILNNNIVSGLVILDRTLLVPSVVFFLVLCRVSEMDRAVLGMGIRGQGGLSW